MSNNRFQLEPMCIFFSFWLLSYFDQLTVEIEGPNSESIYKSHVLFSILLKIIETSIFKCSPNFRCFHTKYNRESFTEKSIEFIGSCQGSSYHPPVRIESTPLPIATNLIFNWFQVLTFHLSRNHSNFLNKLPLSRCLQNHWIDGLVKMRRFRKNRFISKNKFFSMYFLKLNCSRVLFHSVNNRFPTPSQTVPSGRLFEFARNCCENPALQ